MATDDESVSQFMTFTGCQDTDTASNYLEMSGGNVETAVGLFMEHGERQSSSSQLASASNDTFTSSNNDGINNNNNSSISSSTHFAPGEVNSRSNEYNPYNPEDVRAPDPTRTERLVESWGGGHANPLTDNLLHQAIHNESLSSSPRIHAFAFADPIGNDGTEGASDGVSRATNVRDLINEAAASNSNQIGSRRNPPSSSNRTNPKTLADMFAPPTHILHRAGGFQGARNRAKDERKWLLVNLQTDADFACHALNRDVWGNDLAEALITSSFIFWQAMNDTGDGSTYIQRYSVDAFPHIAIIDPRTGRLMWKREGWTQVDPMTSEQFAQIAADFCSQHSFDKPPTASAAGFRPNRPTKRSVEDLSEQEQLEKAIRESQGLDVEMDDDSHEDDDNFRDMNYDDEEVESDDEVEVIPPPAARLKSDSSNVENASTSYFTTPTALPTKPPQRQKTFEEIITEMYVGEEPKKNGATVQIRMPDGGKRVRKFNKEDMVKVIYAFVAQSNEEAKKGKII